MNEVVCKNLNSLEVESTSHAIGLKRILLKDSECESMLTQAAIGYLLKGDVIGNHVHPTMEEYYFFTKGKAKLTIDNAEYFCKKDTFIKIPKNSMHSLMAITKIEFIYWGIAI